MKSRTGEKYHGDLRREALPEELLRRCMDILADKKGGEIISLDLKGLSIIADYFVCCTASSPPHIRALSGHLQKTFSREFKLKPRVSEGTAESGWIVLDYGDIVVHIFTAETRAKYRIESLWGDAPRNEDIRVLADKGNG